jgi:hypothetical protein
VGGPVNATGLALFRQGTVMRSQARDHELRIVLGRFSYSHVLLRCEWQAILSLRMRK